MLFIGWLIGIVTSIIVLVLWAFSHDLKRLGRKMFRRVWKARCSKCGAEYRGYNKGFWIPRRFWLARHRSRRHGDHEDVDRAPIPAPQPNPKFLQP
jgi:hypothetical protein